MLFLWNDQYSMCAAPKWSYWCFLLRVPWLMQATGRDKVSVEESKVKASYSRSKQTVSLSRSESFQHAVANDIVSVASLPASNHSA